MKEEFDREEKGRINTLEQKERKKNERKTQPPNF